MVCWGAEKFLPGHRFTMSSKDAPWALDLGERQLHEPKLTETWLVSNRFKSIQSFSISSSYNKIKNIQMIPSNQATYSIPLIQPSSYWNSLSETLPSNLIFAPNTFAFQPTLHPWVFPGCACVRWSRAATRSRSGTRRSWPWTDVFGKVWEAWQIENF